MPSRPRLGVNIDHVATLRQARKTPYPDVVLAAHIAENAGADQITCHLREDRRHIQDSDLVRLRGMVRTRLNLEMAATPEIVEIALKVRPDIVTLVPEKREELTTEGGLDLYASSFIEKGLELLQSQGISVSLFINPDPREVKRAKELGATAVELHAGIYAEAPDATAVKKEFERIQTTAREGANLKLKIFAGHGLHYENISRLVSIPEIEEYNIGHSIVSRALFVGLEEAIREMKSLLLRP